MAKQSGNSNVGSKPSRSLNVGVIKFNEALFKSVLANASVLIILLLSAVFITLVVFSLPALKANGFYFLTGTVWDPNLDKYGALPFLVGTIITSLLALLISFPFSISLAILLGEFYRKGALSALFRNIIELLAGVPSVIYGFVAIYYLVPAINDFGIGLGYAGTGGRNLLTASIVLAIMIIPYSASVAREVINLSPSDLREACYALGSTRFELIRHVILPYTSSGIIAGNILSLGRAIGETMAVTMVIGNVNQLPHNLFSGANSMSSIIANDFPEAGPAEISSLTEIGLLLFLITMLFNILGKQLINQLSKR